MTMTMIRDERVDLCIRGRNLDNDGLLKQINLSVMAASPGRLSRFHCRCLSLVSSRGGPLAVTLQWCHLLPCG